MNAKPATALEAAAVAAAVQRFQRLRSSKTTHAALTAAAKVDLTQQSLQLLVAIHDGQTSSDLARASNMDAAAVSRELRRMESAGLVARGPSPHHHAGVVVRLTDSGRDARARVIRVRDAHLERALSSWTSEEASTLASLLRRFSDDLEASPLAPCAERGHGGDA